GPGEQHADRVRRPRPSGDGVGDPAPKIHQCLATPHDRESGSGSTVGDDVVEHVADLFESSTNRSVCGVHDVILGMLASSSREYGSCGAVRTSSTGPLSTIHPSRSTAMRSAT